MPRLILYNIAYGQGCTGKRIEYLAFWRRLFPSTKKIAAIGNALRDAKPDIVGLLEVDGNRSTELSHSTRMIDLMSQFSDIKSELQSAFGDVSNKYASQGISRLARFIPILRKQSNGILSHYTIVDHHHYYLTCGMKRLVSKYVVLIGKKKCTLFLVHLALGQKIRTKQLRELSILTRVVRGPMIVMGDFNAAPAELGPLLANSKKLKDVAIATQSKSSFTFPAYRPSKKIDYILASPQIKCTLLQTFPWLLSDHLPLCLDFDIE